MAKGRLDKLLVSRGLAASRERAQALILAGRVLVSEQRVDKPGTAVSAEVAIRMLGQDMRYVSRGGLKLERALQHWALDVKSARCADIGASTGGFTDCLLQHGAEHVLAVDTGYGQMAQKLRIDPQVTLLERTNARLLRPGELAEVSPAVRFLVMDVSFISASTVLPAVLDALAQPGERWRGTLVLLIKPQFEAGREFVGKGGIVRDPRGRELAVERIRGATTACGGLELDVIASPIRGMEGNEEYLLRAVFPG